MWSCELTMMTGERMKKDRMRIALVCGMRGCLCDGGGDWLMLYGDPAHHGARKALSLLMPVSAFRLGFTNGLMSESMIVWLGIMLAWEPKMTRGGDAG